MSDKKVSEMSIEEKALLLESAKKTMKERLLDYTKVHEEVKAKLEAAKKKIADDTEFSGAIVLDYFKLWALEENVKNGARAIEFMANACIAENYGDYIENSRSIISAISDTPGMCQDEEEEARDMEIFNKGFKAGADELHRRLTKKK